MIVAFDNSYDIVGNYCHALYPFCVHLLRKFQKWTQTDTKVTFLPTHPPPTMKHFWFHMNGIAKHGPPPNPKIFDECPILLEIIKEFAWCNFTQNSLIREKVKL